MDLAKVTQIEKLTFKKLSQIERHSIFIETQVLANYRKSRFVGDRTAYPNWQLGKVRIARQHGIHRNHINAIIREFSGQSSSSRVSQHLPRSPY